MALKNVWHDDGTVKCVDSADSPAVISGAEKATADTELVGEITLDHVVTVEDGVVTKAEYVPPPINWLARIATERELRLSTRIPVTLSDGEYIIPVSDRAAALAPNAEKRARKHGKKVPFPTDKGIIDFDAADFSTIEDALGEYLEGVFHRERELQVKVADGSIAEADLESGWPDHA